MQDLDSFIDKVKNLPAVPAVLPKLLALLRKTEVDNEEVIKLITFEPALTAHVLRACNSAMFGTSRPADDVHEAVMRLGFRELYRIVAMVIGAQALSGVQKGYGIEAGELWRHSATVALACQIIAQTTSNDDSIAFTAGLLHDVGKLVLAGTLEGKYDQIIEETEVNHLSLAETERRILGVDHAAVGGRLLERWKLPPSISQAVTFQYEPAKAKPHEATAAVVHLGNLIALQIGEAFGHQALAIEGRPEALDILSLKPDDLQLLMIKTIESMSAVKALLQAPG